MEREIRAEIAAEHAARGRDISAMPIEAVRAEVLRRIGHIRAHRDRNRLEEGWTQTPGGDWIPPGYGPIPGWTAPGDSGAPTAPAAPDTPLAGEAEGETPRDSI